MKWKVTQDRSGPEYTSVHLAGQSWPMTIVVPASIDETRIVSAETLEDVQYWYPNAKLIEPYEEPYV